MRTPEELAAAALKGEEVVYVVLGPFDMGVAAAVGAIVQEHLAGSPVPAAPVLRLACELTGTGDE